MTRSIRSRLCFACRWQEDTSIDRDDVHIKLAFFRSPHPDFMPVKMPLTNTIFSALLSNRSE